MMNRIPMKKIEAGFYMSIGGVYKIERGVSKWYAYHIDKVIGRFNTKFEAEAGIDEYIESRKLTVEEKIAMLTDEMLLRLYLEEGKKQDEIEMFEKAQAEILKRMKKEA